MTREEFIKLRLQAPGAVRADLRRAQAEHWRRQREAARERLERMHAELEELPSLANDPGWLFRFDAAQQWLRDSESRAAS